MSIDERDEMYMIDEAGRVNRECIGEVGMIPRRLSDKEMGWIGTRVHKKL